MIRGVLTVLFLACAACGVAPQPESTRTVAAFEVPLPKPSDRAEFLEILRREARASGFHVDAATPEELRSMSEVIQLTVNAAVWRGDNDVEIIASAMDLGSGPGKIWISFHKGEDPPRVAAFRNELMRKLTAHWPETRSLPIMPTGAIPLPGDLIRTPSGYVVNPATTANYGLPRAPPAAPK